LIKSAKLRDQQQQQQDSKKEIVYQPKNSNIQPLSGKKELLENVIVKPNLEGKKTIGNLEIQKNGLSFMSSKGVRLDILFSNIKHAFFQPCS
jgi:nucleosome binding factor SPN SPT16 subunit